MAAADEREDPPESIYRARADAFNAQTEQLSRRFNRIANLRLVAFVGAAACLIWGIAAGLAAAVGLGLALGATFVSLVRYHRQLGLQRDRTARLRDVNLQTIERLARRWDNVPLRHRTVADTRHPYAADLDVFGRASLLHLLDTTHTWMGQTLLTQWLLKAASPDAVRARQAAVAELASKLDLRQELEAAPGDSPRSDPASLLAWAESGSPRLRPGHVWVARLSPVLLVAFGLAQITGLSSWPLWLVFLFVNIVMWQVVGQRAYTALSLVGDQEPALRQYAADFELLSATTFDAPRLRTLHQAVHPNGRSAAAAIHSLERIARCVIPRSALAYWAVQIICLWDVHVLSALEDWQATAGPNVHEWLEALGEIEALAALATLAHAHPDWIIPDIDPAACQLEAQQAGHPLLAPGTRVDNAVSLGPPGSFLLVTGSNMAGKSTYLRTIGTNIVLAQAGGPVCARAFRMPPLQLCTSMRVVDSLERGVSTFLAELVRLKQVVDVARQANTDRIVCYLLDEILQGTNSAERQVAVRQVILFLLTQPAIGAVSTHDLALADLPELAAHAQFVHFQETLSAAPQGPIMSFGYRLQPGIATSTNALRLVAMLGLDEGSGGASDGPGQDEPAR